MGENRKFLKGFLVGVGSAILLGGAAVFGVVASFGGKAVNLAHIQKLGQLEKIIDAEYLGEQDTEMMANGMYLGLVAGLNDPYSRYYTKEQYEEANSRIQGEYVGIGVVMQMGSDQVVRIAECYENSSAAEAGILPEDVLLAINGTSIEGMALSEVSQMIKTTKEESVVLTISREGEEEPLDITVQVRNIEVTSVSYKMLEDEVGYLKIASFTHVSSQQYQNAMEDLKAQGMKRLIVDLRDNTGGLLDAVCEILNEILPEGLIVYTEDKNGSRSEKTCDGEHPLDIPLVVLVNENSASASEIFAGAVQDHKVGTIVGTVTYGKGVVQTTKVFQDGSALKLTISHYYTPNGNDIHGVGILPDVEVELPEASVEKWNQGEELSLEEDTQLTKALEIAKEK